MSIYLLKTDRLGLRPFHVDDAMPFYKMNLDHDVLKYTGDKAFKSIEEAKYFIQNYEAYSKWGFGRWAVVNLKDSSFIGFCGFKLNEEDQVDIGFRIKKQEWNKGYATEAAQASLHYGFENLHFEAVIGRAAQENTASIRIMNKLNMKKWKYGPCDGMEDAVYFRITKDQFRSSQN